MVGVEPQQINDFPVHALARSQQRLPNAAGPHDHRQPRTMKPLNTNTIGSPLASVPKPIGCKVRPATSRQILEKLGLARGRNRVGLAGRLSEQFAVAFEVPLELLRIARLQAASLVDDACLSAARCRLRRRGTHWRRRAIRPALRQRPAADRRSPFHDPRAPSRGNRRSARPGRDPTHRRRAPGLAAEKASGLAGTAPSFGPLAAASPANRLRAIESVPSCSASAPNRAQAEMIAWPARHCKVCRFGAGLAGEGHFGKL